MSAVIDLSNMHTRIALIRSFTTTVRESRGLARTAMYRPRDLDMQIRAEIKAIRAALPQQISEQRSDADLRQQAERLVRERYTKAFLDSYASARDTIQRMAKRADEMHAYVRKPRLPKIDTGKGENEFGSSGLRPLLFSIEREMKLARYRAEAGDLTVDEQLALLQDPESEPELVTVLDRTVERTLAKLQSTEERDRLVKESTAGLQGEAALKAMTTASAEWKARHEAIASGLEATRAARVTPEERTAFEEWNTAASEAWRDLDSLGVYALTVQQSGDLADGINRAA